MKYRLLCGKIPTHTSSINYIPRLHSTLNSASSRLFKDHQHSSIIDEYTKYTQYLSNIAKPLQCNTISRWGLGNFGPKLWVWLMDKAFWKNPWLKHMISTYGNSCIQELSTSRSQNERKLCVSIRNATNNSSANQKQMSRVPQIHSRCENKALHLCIFRPYVFEYCTVFLVSAIQHSLTCTFLGL